MSTNVCIIWVRLVRVVYQLEGVPYALLVRQLVGHHLFNPRTIRTAGGYVLVTIDLVLEEGQQLLCRASLYFY